MSGDDRDLREGFSALRREEGLLAPDFGALAGREDPGGGGKSPGWHIATVACLAAATLGAAILAILWLQPVFHREKKPDEAASITAWRSPTGFLLDTPGREMLESVPAIAVPGPPGKDRRAGKQVFR